jgi:hypothetical protein
VETRLVASRDRKGVNVGGPDRKKGRRGPTPSDTAVPDGANGLINECTVEDPIDMEEYFQRALTNSQRMETEEMLEGLLEEDDNAGVMWEMATLEGMSVGGVLSETSGLEQPSMFSGSTVSSGDFSPQEPRVLPMEDVLRDVPQAQPDESMAVIYKMCDDARCPLGFADHLMRQIRTEILEHQFDPFVGTYG